MARITEHDEQATWSFGVGVLRGAIHQQAALEFLVKTLAEDEHAASHRLIAALREQADEVRYHDPQVGITGDAEQATALDALANLLAAECDRD